jgi:hypothetical protein
MNSDKLKQSEKLDLHYTHNSFIKKENQQKLCKSNRLILILINLFFKRRLRNIDLVLAVSPF